jgi:hypothetical protein
MTIIVLHILTVTAAACRTSVLQLEYYNQFVTWCPCLTDLEEELVKRLDLETAVDKFDSENQNIIHLNK